MHVNIWQVLTRFCLVCACECTDPYQTFVGSQLQSNVLKFEVYKDPTSCWENIFKMILMFFIIICQCIFPMSPMMHHWSLQNIIGPSKHYRQILDTRKSILRCALLRIWNSQIFFERISLFWTCRALILRSVCLSVGWSSKNYKKIYKTVQSVTNH